METANVNVIYPSAVSQLPPHSNNCILIKMTNCKKLIANKARKTW